MKHGEYSKIFFRDARNILRRRDICGASLDSFGTNFPYVAVSAKLRVKTMAEISLLTARRDRRSIFLHDLRGVARRHRDAFGSSPVFLWSFTRRCSESP